MSEFNEPTQAELEDAIIEDTVHCDLCGSAWDIGGNADGITINSREYRLHGGAAVGYGQIKLCIDCSLHAARVLRDELANKDICEHGIVCGDWCEPCNKAYKQALIDNNMI